MELLANIHDATNNLDVSKVLKPKDSMKPNNWVVIITYLNGAFVFPISPLGNAISYSHITHLQCNYKVKYCSTWKISA